MYTRYSKIALVWAAALFATLVAFNNLTDYGSNFAFVSHVLSMDTTFPDNQGMWRALNSPAIHHSAYALIIATESLVAILCWMGGYRLLRSAKDAERFNQAKGLAIVGLTLGVILWFTGFIAIGGEWFLMWQSKIWNGQQGAFRFTVILGVTMIYLNMPDTNTQS
ncbi:predicted small integral membrane protein [Hahella chejuensis KCTC 2396]|uniref:Predicted small integral membrane protein n=1 Tax=Hahella chejuensis (strain KCTC 2396) TaxID=349521 RepID=Q2SB69_HAHCH|nr:DUF2165 domain-containing protein [Hahella chejuensis]ABC32105.1 predicted small integral membrane protein [Hahella chejuensis KCTC 2396]